MAVHRYVDMSTAHVTQKDMELLESQGDLGVVAYDYNEGVFVYVPPEEDLPTTLGAAQERGLSDSFCKALTYASQQGAYLLRLDADGDMIEDPQLDLHDWESSDGSGSLH